MRTNKLASFKLLSIYREQFVAANSLERLTSDDKSNFGFFPQKKSNPVRALDLNPDFRIQPVRALATKIGKKFQSAHPY